MTINNVEAAHSHCPASKRREVRFTYTVGDPAICPRCHEVVLAEPLVGLTPKIIPVAEQPAEQSTLPASGVVFSNN